MSGYVEGRIMCAFIDTAADLSLIPYSWKRYGKITKLRKHIKIRSFDGKSKQILKKSVSLKVNFGNVAVNLNFYLCKTKTPIIGVDLLRDPHLHLSINTKNEKFYIDRRSMRTANNEITSDEYLQNRIDQAKTNNEIHKDKKQINWLRSKQDFILKPNSTTDIITKCDLKPSKHEKQSLLSLYDNDNDDIYIPSMILWSPEKDIVITIENKTDQKLLLKNGTPLGELKPCTDTINHRSVMAFDSHDIREAFRQIRIENEPTIANASKIEKGAKSKTQCVNECTIESLVDKHSYTKRMHSENNPTCRLVNSAAIEVGSDRSAEKAKGGWIDASGSNDSHALKAFRACDRVEDQMNENTAHKYSLRSKRGDEIVPIAGTEQSGMPVNEKNPDKVNQYSDHRLSGGEKASNVVKNDNDRRRRGRPERQKKGRPPDISIDENASEGQTDGPKVRDVPDKESIREYSENLEEQERVHNTDTPSAFPENEEPMRLSELIGMNKVPSETLAKCYKDGITIDLDLNVDEPDIDIDESPINVDYERTRGQNFKYWPNKHEYLKQFDLTSVEGKDREKLINILLDFNHIFFNEDRPDQFHKGVEMQPIKIRLKENAPPLKKEGPRRISSTKLPYLKAHLKQMLERGIIEEMPDNVDCHMSPIHVVLESRFYASLKKNVIQSRFCLDNRILNNSLADVQFPLPLASEFRREVAKEGFTTFSNFDASKMFYQFKIDPESVKKYFGFYALGRVYLLKRLAMGLKTSISYVQKFMDKCFRSHKNCLPFVDDLSVRSMTINTHLNIDLPLALAICSKYNILLSPKKSDLLKNEVRVLGFQLGRSSESIADEKKTKIRGMAFPDTKKDAISKAAFFSYFLSVAPKLSHLMAPLRKLAHPKTRFKPTESDKKSFTELKEYLLDDEVGALRMPSNDKHATILIWTDSSSTSIGCVITQLLPPLPGSKLDPTKRYLCIVGCYSRKIEDTWSVYPIWILELTALEECTRKFFWLLAGRSFYALTDNTTLTSWASLDHVPKDVARMVLRLQRFDYRILWIKSELNLSDWISRIPVDSPPEARFPRFLAGRIYDGKGKNIPWQKLFCKAAAKETKDFFTRKRRQELAHAVEPENFIIPDEGEAENEVKEIVDALKSPPEIHISDGDSATRSAKEEYTNVIAAYSLTDDQVENGENELENDTEIDNDITQKVTLNRFKGHRLESVRRLQENDDTITDIINRLKSDQKDPPKTESLILSPALKHFLKNKSLFRVTEDGILLRLWHNANGKFDQLIVVGEKQFQVVATEAHQRIESAHRHAGQRRTFLALSKRYFAFNMRAIIYKVVNICATCKLNKYPRTNAIKTGNKIATSSNEKGEIDIQGPVAGFGSSSTGQPQNVYYYIDLHSRYTITKVIPSCADNHILDSLIYTRDTLCGLPKTIQMDNALCSPSSKSAEFLKERGVQINHGMANVSRCQSAVERSIGTLSRYICNLRTDNPKWSFRRIVAEATYIANSTPHTSLPNSLSPKEIHFNVAPSDFLIHQHERDEMSDDAAGAARAASRATLVNDVKRFLKSKEKAGVTDYTKKIRPGMICLRKRTSFPSSSPKKLCYKITFEGYMVTSKVATNSFRCRNIKTNEETIIPGDLLVKMKGLTENEAVELINEMERVAAKEAETTTAPAKAGGRRSTRIAVQKSRTDPVTDPDLGALFTVHL